ncbi:hypothetical protein HYH03_011682 [Edaphochlamys debaryana]|uniref:H-type lectin domain-containing protein n=1 Tax=Edaphochlamys debaryana TaxID=47281 RepID=A0A836BUY2_9CHLO|nr:hypothetical protein HYH03_011682 [Edaphochlamys debaryana]|eukprot:KAG2489880.1 hypothetical protein HYH03_011682 [Edaphochlamys debaryana]
MSALCEDYEAYSYSTYDSERADLDNYIDQHAGGEASWFQNTDFKNLASAYCKSKAHSFDVAAKASYGIYGGGGSYKEGSSSNDCGSQSSEAFTASNSAITSSSAEVAYLSQTVDPNIVAAYTACLDLYDEGVRISQKTGIGAKSFAVDIKFMPTQPGASATLTGVTIYPAGTAVCRMMGCASTLTTSSLSAAALTDGGDTLPAGVSTRAAAAGGNPPPRSKSPPPKSPPPAAKPTTSSCTVSSSMNFKLQPTAVHTIQCEVAGKVAPDSKITEVYISTSVGGTYRGMLYHNDNTTTLDALTQRVIDNENQDSAAVRQLRADLVALKQSLMDEIYVVKTGLRGEAAAAREALDARDAAVEARAASLEARAAALEAVTAAMDAQMGTAVIGLGCDNACGDRPDPNYYADIAFPAAFPGTPNVVVFATHIDIGLGIGNFMRFRTGAVDVTNTGFRAWANVWATQCMCNMGVSWVAQWNN